MAHLTTEARLRHSGRNLRYILARINKLDWKHIVEKASNVVLTFDISKVHGHSADLTRTSSSRGSGRAIASCLRPVKPDRSVTHCFIIIVFAGLIDVCGINYPNNWVFSKMELRIR